MTDGILVEHGVVVVGLTPRAIRGPPGCGAGADREGVRAGATASAAGRAGGADSVRVVSDAFFTPIGDGRFQGEEACIGPWSAAHMHGGPPSALLVRACEQAADEAAAGLVALRASIDFLSAVPVGPVEVSARVVRGGRRITLTESVMTAGGRDVLHARVWHVRAADAQTPVLDQQPPAAVPPPDETEATMQGWRFGYARAMEWRVVGGDPVGPGPATVWTRARIPVVPGEEPSGLQRAVLSADSGNGISAEPRLERVVVRQHRPRRPLSRPLVGEWVLLDAATRYEAGGTGARGVLAVGRARPGRPRRADPRGVTPAGVTPGDHRSDRGAAHAN